MSKSVEARLAHQVSITSDDYARIRRNHPKVQVGSLAWNCTVDGYLLAKHTYLTAGRAEAAADTARLDFVIRWLGTHDTLDCVRDWNDAADARAAIDAALAAK